MIKGNVDERKGTTFLSIAVTTLQKLNSLKSGGRLPSFTPGGGGPLHLTILTREWLQFWAPWFLVGGERRNDLTGLEREDLPFSSSYPPHRG